MTPLAFVDTETDGLGPSRHAWEVAVIRRDDSGETVTHLFLPLDLRRADPQSLNIGRFWDRHPHGRQLSGKPPIPGEMVVTQGLDAAKRIFRATFGAHLVGAVPSFDAQVLERLLRANGLVPQWHYHLVAVEVMALGWMAHSSEGAALRVPYSSRELGEALGVRPASAAERHTALGDARWAMRMWDRMTGGAS